MTHTLRANRGGPAFNPIEGATRKRADAYRRRAVEGGTARQVLYMVRGSRSREEAAESTRVQNRTLIKGFIKVRGCLALNLVSNLVQEGPLGGGSRAPPGASEIGQVEKAQVTGLSDMAVFHSYFPT